MKPIKIFPIVMIAAAGLVASCSTSKLATTSQNDDVYNSVAKAREVEVIPQQQYAQNQNQDQGQDQEGYDEYYGTSNPYYDMDYSSRINRFSNGTSWRGYYDPYYDNFSYGNSYGATNYLGYGGLGWSSGYGLGGWGSGFGIGLGYGSIWNNPFYYGNMGFGWNNFGWNNWGPYSYYDRFGWGGGGFGGGWGYGGGFYGGGVYTGNNNYRARPGNTLNSRGYGNNNGSTNTGRPTRSGVAPQNGNNRQGYSPNYNAGRPTRSQVNGDGRQSGGYSRPDANSSRPGRNENYAPQPQRQETRPTYSAPPTSRGSSGGGSFGGGGGGGSRPTRSGRG